MKSTGIVRKLDQLGRFVLPKELRDCLDWHEGDNVEVFVEGESIILRKYQCSCVFCKSGEDLHDFMGKTVCGSCLEKMKA